MEYQIMSDKIKSRLYLNSNKNEVKITVTNILIFHIYYTFISIHLYIFICKIYNSYVFHLFYYVSTQNIFNCCCNFSFQWIISKILSRGRAGLPGGEGANLFAPPPPDSRARTCGGGHGPNLRISSCPPSHFCAKSGTAVVLCGEIFIYVYLS